MQKLDLRNNLQILASALKSTEIVTILDAPGAISGQALLHLVIESKSAYDKLTMNADMKSIIRLLAGNELYMTDQYSSIVVLIPQGNVPANNLLVNQTSIRRFFDFHKTLSTTFRVIDGLLFTDRQIFDTSGKVVVEDLTQKGLLMLETIDKGDIPLGKVTTVLQSVQNLLDIVILYLEKIEQKKVERLAHLILLDTGTGINITIKLPEEATKIIGQIISELWQLVVSNELFRHKKRNEFIAESLTTLQKIKEAVDTGVITREEGEQWKRGIIHNTRKIVLNNTLPKALLQESTEVSNRDLLLAQAHTLLLTEGSRDDAHIDSTRGSEDDKPPIPTIE
jgi:hypothetical protein